MPTDFVFTGDPTAPAPGLEPPKKRNKIKRKPMARVSIDLSDGFEACLRNMAKPKTVKQFLAEHRKALNECCLNGISYKILAKMVNSWFSSKEIDHKVSAKTIRDLVTQPSKVEPAGSDASQVAD